MKKTNRPKGTDQLSKNIVDLAVGEKTEQIFENTKNPHAVELGRLGGLVGGNARAQKLSAEKRSDIARLAAQVRWNKKE